MSDPTNNQTPLDDGFSLLSEVSHSGDKALHNQTTAKTTAKKKVKKPDDESESTNKPIE